MPLDLNPISFSYFKEKIDQHTWTRECTTVHWHHTYRPNHKDWEQRGPEKCMTGIYNFHTTVRGWSDFGQHITIDPKGLIWLGRRLNIPPASAIGHNGNYNAGPFMFEMIGDFRTEALEGEQLKTALEVTRAIHKKFDLEPEAVMFHNEMSKTECPGLIDKKKIVSQLKKTNETTRESMVEDISQTLEDWWSYLWD